MDAVDDATRGQLTEAGSLRTKYAEAVDRASAHEMITARLNGAAEVVAGDPSAGAPLPPPPPGTPPPPTSEPAPKAQPKPSGRAKAATTTKPKVDSTSGLGDDVKDIGVGFAKDMLTTADGRRTLRTVFGALFGKK